MKTIGKVSTITGINIETIRYYEKIQLIDEPDRSEGGNRLYFDKQINQLNFIKRSRELGFSLEEIRALLTLSAESASDCQAAQNIANAHLDVVKTKIKDLKRLAKVLENLSAKCDAAGSNECPILSSLNRLEE